MDINVQNFDSGAIAFVDDNEYSNVTLDEAWASVKKVQGKVSDGKGQKKIDVSIPNTSNLASGFKQGNLKKILTERRKEQEVLTGVSPKPTTNTITQNVSDQKQIVEQPKKNNLILPIAIGGGVLVLGVILYFALRKSN